MTILQIDNLQAKALAGDKLAAAQFRAAKWNATVPVGASCLYLKSEIEGKVIAKSSRAAWASGEDVFIELEHIGMVLLDKVELEPQQTILQDKGRQQASARRGIRISLIAIILAGFGAAFIESVAGKELGKLAWIAAWFIGSFALLFALVLSGYLAHSRRGTW